jgi:hypothetical protein
MLGGPVEFVRHLIIARTTEGRKRARAHGVPFGPPRKLTRTSATKPSRAAMPAMKRYGHRLQRQRQPLNDQPPMIGRVLQNLGVKIFSPRREHHFRTRFADF